MRRTRLPRIASAQLDISVVEHGDIVRFTNQQGQVLSGRAVMRSVFPDSWVLNTGGQYGRPALVSRQNFVSVSKRR